MPSLVPRPRSLGMRLWYALSSRDAVDHPAVSRSREPSLVPRPSSLGTRLWYALSSQDAEELQVQTYFSVVGTAKPITLYHIKVNEST